MADRPQPRPARSSGVVDLAGLDQRVAELTEADERRQQRSGDKQGNEGAQANDEAQVGGSTGAHGADPLTRVASMLAELRDDVDGMRTAFLDLPTMDELDGRMAALETRLTTVEAALATTSRQVTYLVALLGGQARRP